MTPFLPPGTLQELSVTLLYFLEAGQFWIFRRKYFLETLTSKDWITASRQHSCSFCFAFEFQSCIWALRQIVVSGFLTCFLWLCSIDLPRAFISWTLSHTRWITLQFFPPVMAPCTASSLHSCSSLHRFLLVLTSRLFYNH